MRGERGEINAFISHKICALIWTNTNYKLMLLTYSAKTKPYRNTVVR